MPDVGTLVTVAHGTRRSGGNEIARDLTALAGERLGIEARVSYVELCDPLFADVVRDHAAGGSGTAVVVPLLLSTGFHIRHDLPEAVAAAGSATHHGNSSSRGPEDDKKPWCVRLGGPLGPDPQLAAAQADRLRTAGAAPGQPVTMVAAGSTDPDALDDLETARRHLADAWGAPVRLATLAGLGPRLPEVVQPGDALSPYLLSPGYFADKARDEATALGATVAADVIGVHPRVVELVCDRARALAG